MTYGHHAAAVCSSVTGLFRAWNSWHPPLVFLSHQTGSFIGAWLGGRIYDVAQDYTPMWWAAVVLGLLAALIHLPIREEPGPLARAEARADA